MEGPCISANNVVAWLQQFEYRQMQLQWTKYIIVIARDHFKLPVVMVSSVLLATHCLEYA